MNRPNDNSMIPLSTSSLHHERLNEQEQLNQIVKTGAAIIFLPRVVTTTPPVTPRPLPSECRDEELAFRQDFQEGVIDLVKELRREFPYKQTIRWSIEYGEDKHYSLHILVKPSRLMDDH